METLPEENLTGVNKGELYPNFPLKYLTATSVVGDEVWDFDEQPMGKIEDIMLDISSGKIEYYVVEFGGFLGIGTKYFAIPFNMLQVNPEKKHFIFRGKKDLLNDAPGFDVNHWPETNFHREETYWNF